jgi:putative tryptophan/tyrosine transport system substrate-binding protein
MNPKFFWLITAILLASIHPAEAQQPAKIPGIGYLLAGFPSSTSDQVAAFRHGLRKLGYEEGKNVTINFRYAEGKLDRLPELAVELVRLKVDVIVSPGIQPSQAAKRATTTIPIVFPGVGDPVGWGLVISLARPGGNLTGFTNFSPELSGKKVELLKESFPKLSRAAVLRDPSQPPQSFNETETAGQSVGIKIQSLEIRNPADLETAFSAMTKDRTEAVITLPQTGINIHRRRIVDFTVKSRLPSVHSDRPWAEAGGLMSYGPDNIDLSRRSAIYVDKILKGTKPADLPVEQPTKFELVINLKTAKQIGLTIPQSVLYKADRVIT